MGTFYMKTFSHLWQYLANFFLEWEKFSDKICKEIQNTVAFPKNVLLIR